MSESGSFRPAAAIHQGVERHPSIKPDTLAHPPAEVLDAVARKETRRLLRRLGVPGDLTPDLVQEVVTTAYLALHRKGAALPLPAQHEPRWCKVRPFLAGIARRHARDARRRAHRRHEVPTDRHSFDDAVPGEPTPEQRAASAQRLDLLFWILARMPSAYAEVLVLYAVEEMTVSEIAARLGVSENTVKSRLARARTHAQRTVRNLPREKRRLLEGSPLGALLFWTGSSKPPVGRRLGALHASLCVLVAGLGIAGGPVGSIARPPDGALVVAVDEHAPPPASPAVETPPAPPDHDRAVADTLTMPSSTPAQAAELDTLPAEKHLIRVARRALDSGSLSPALVSLAAHKQQYPNGKLAGVRQALEIELRARVRAHPYPTR